MVTQDGITLNGKLLDREQAINFKESCVVLKDNFARKVLNEQVRFLAVNLGINVALSVDTILFAKAALWILQQEDDLLDKIYAS